MKFASSYEPNQYEAQKACYKDVADYDTSKIEANIKEAQSKIE